MHSNEDLLSSQILKQHGYRVTSTRVALLTFLRSLHSPVSASAIAAKLKPAIDKVTLYRALHDFCTSGIIKEVNLPGTTAYYEYVHTDDHHHHIVCKGCGAIEDIEMCHEDDLQSLALKETKKFRSVTSHSLEFFGLCTSCSA